MLQVVTKQDQANDQLSKQVTNLDALTGIRFDTATEQIKMTNCENEALRERLDNNEKALKTLTQAAKKTDEVRDLMLQKFEELTKSINDSKEMKRRSKAARHENGYAGAGLSATENEGEGGERKNDSEEHSNL